MDDDAVTAIQMSYIELCNVHWRASEILTEKQYLQFATAIRALGTLSLSLNKKKAA